MPQRFTPTQPPSQPPQLQGRFTPLSAPTQTQGRFQPSPPGSVPNISGAPPSDVDGGSMSGVGGGSFSATGSTAPSVGPFGNIAGMGLGFNMGPLSLGVSPLGTMGLGLNFNQNTGNQGLNALSNTMGNMGLSQLGKQAGVPLSFNPLSLIGAIAPALGPFGLGLSGFNAAISLANAIAQMSGTMTTQQALQAVTAAPQGNQMDATMTQNALSDAMSSALAGRTIGQNDPFGLAALSALGLQGAQFQGGYIASNAAGVPVGQIASPSPFGVSSVSGTTGAQAEGVPGVPGVSFSAEGGMVGPPSDTSPIGNIDTGQLSTVAAEEAGPSTDGPAGGVGGVSTGAGEEGVGTGGPGAGEGGEGGGGGGGGGGCYLASWTLSALKPKDAAESRQAFQSFYAQFMKANPEHGKRMFVLYQRLAQQIIQRARQVGADRSTQEYIYHNFVQPTGEYISKKELPQAVSNLINVVRTLAKQFGIPLPRRFVPIGK